MPGENFRQQAAKEIAFMPVKAVEQFVLDLVRHPFEVIQMQHALRGDRDRVAAAVGRVWVTHDEPGLIEPRDNGVYVVAVKAEAPPEIGLAQRSSFLQRCENGEVSPAAQRHARRG